ncbi:hypothetical protein CA607_20345 [Caulobacter vibrioides]|nr:hypothetical protein CA607_20345 [Caulobacter vibrioides]
MPGSRSSPPASVRQTPRDVASSPAAPDESGPRQSPGRSVVEVSTKGRMPQTRPALKPDLWRIEWRYPSRPVQAPSPPRRKE